MSNTRGFLMRSFIPMGGLTVSRGLGGAGNEIITGDESERFDKAIGGSRRVTISATRRKAPSAFTKRKKSRNC